MLQVKLFGGIVPEGITNLTYSLDGKPNSMIVYTYPNFATYDTPILASDVLSGLNDGEHVVVIRGSTSYGTGFGGNVTFTVDSHAKLGSDIAPKISILSPRNETYEYLEIREGALTFWVNKPFAWARFKIDDYANLTVNGNTTLASYQFDIETGPHTLDLYVIDGAGNVASDTIQFNVVPSVGAVTLLSPGNQTYTGNVTLSFVKTRAVLWVQYTLDDQPQVLAENTTLTNLTVGSHSIAISFHDLDGDQPSGEKIYFTVGEPFPTNLFVAAFGGSVAAVGVFASAIYLKKRKGHVAS